jgi:diguanylate cyclase (GGDEF)-like protein
VFGGRDRDRLTAELAAARARVVELEAEVHRLSARDPIAADLLTRHAFMSQLELDVQRAHRYGRPLAVVLIDVDRFRYLNLKHGYGAGDLVLGGVGAAIVRCSRAHDVACRVGGDEFAVLLPETDSEGAVDAVERILTALAELEAVGVRGHSASAGIAVLEASQTPEALLAAAAEALEGARAGGGGQLMVYSPAADRRDPVSGMHADAVTALAATLGERQHPGEDAHRVAELASGVAEALELPSERIARLRRAAALHAVGKVGVPEEILTKPGPLKEREWELVRRHPVVAERIVAAMPGMAPVAEIVRHQHERWDGEGYPDGLAGEEIPLESRIILACNAYAAMTSDRSYRPALTVPEALTELTGNAGTQFDARIVEALVGGLDGSRERGLAAVDF